MRAQVAKQSMALLFLSQLLLLLAALTQYLYLIPVTESAQAVSRLEQTITLVSFVLSILLNIVSATRIGKLFAAEALLNAREAMAESFAGLAGSVQAQHQNFNYQLEEIAGLIRQGRFGELSAYLNAVATKIGNLNNALKVDNPIIGALLRAKIAEADIRHVRLEIDIGATLSNLGTLNLDLARIIGNLVDNALDAVMATEEKIVTVAIRRTGPFLQLEVSNTGPGIQDATAKHVFEPGFTTKSEGHSGLGLYIVKTLAEKMFGTVQLQPDATGRTRFVVLLPGN